MDSSKTYEDYPCWIIVVSNLVSIGIYLIGGFIIFQIGLIWLLIYLVCVAGLEIKLMKTSCVNCYYYGKYCAFGKGKISSLFFKRGSPEKFLHRKITWKTMIPELLVSLIPLIVGIILLILDFNWLILLLIVLLLIFTSLGNGFVRGSLACKFCKQRKLGCPAERLFSKRD